MSRAFTIISPAEQLVFDLPPVFDARARKKYFHISPSLNSLLEKKVRTYPNKVMFVVSLGYFYACKQFFKEFNKTDIEYAASQLGIEAKKITIDDYSYDSKVEHQKLILEYFGFEPFRNKAKILCAKEAKIAVRSQVRPSLLIEQMVELLIKNNFLVPQYQKLAKIISEEFNNHQTTLINRVDQNLSKRDRATLQALFESSDTQVSRSKLTLLKRFSQSTRPKKIQQNIEDLVVLRELFNIAKPLLSTLDLNSDGIRRYAHTVIKSEMFQVSRRKEPDRFLHLIAFITHQYYRLQDLLTDVLLTSVTSAKNASEKELKDIHYENRKIRANKVNKLVAHAEEWIIAQDKCIRILLNENMQCDQKVTKLFKLFGLSEEEQADFIKVVYDVRADSQATLSEEGLMNILEANSRRLQNRVSDIVKTVTFVPSDANCVIFRAIQTYQRTDGQVPNNSPLSFLTSKQKGHIKNESGKIRISLYKSLLFIHIANAVKSGALNVENSYKYRSLEDYLIPTETWNKNKEMLLKQIDMSNYLNFSDVIRSLDTELDREFYDTNTHILNKDNAHVKPDDNGGYRMSNARYEVDEEDLPQVDLFPKTHCISLSEVLSTVEKPTNFLKELVHQLPKNTKRKPPNSAFFAGIIGYGCQIGTQRIAKISKNIKEDKLEQTVKWYFDLDNLQRASDRILEFIGKMELPKIYQDDIDVLHTSSDGQKFNVTEESLNASYSFKYHGKSKGLSEYSHIDAGHRFYHSDVITSAERESQYVIDGLMRNEVVKSDIHSTDSHGQSLTVFGVMYLLGFTFAPRIKNVHKKHLYALKSRGFYNKKGYPILPEGKIVTSDIEKSWDNVLRFVATIKTKETTASQLFRRLNSYSKDNPLHIALDEFGKIIRTIFILNYIDDPDLRDAIHKQLNKSESGNKLSRALSVGSPEFKQATKEEQEIAESCKRLIKNAIVCWNYMYLSQELVNEKNPKKKKELLSKIKRGSVVSWPHFNFHGEFDFSDENMQDSVGFKISQILREKLPTDEDS